MVGLTEKIPGLKGFMIRFIDNRKFVRNFVVKNIVVRNIVVGNFAVRHFVPLQQ